MQVPADSLLGAALLYARAGWAVFPCRSDKRPETAHGFLDATLDEERITRWWSGHDSPIGMPLSPGYLVLDIDGVDVFEELERRGLELPDTLIASTPRGWHYWYRSSTPLGPRAGLLPHLDLRTVGSYVIVPPSPGYRWLHVQGIARGLG